LWCPKTDLSGSSAVIVVGDACGVRKGDRPT
jgi:hypothetical protein